MSGLDAEVLVVGGGPAGSATAALLARQGHDVLLLEKAGFPREKPCAEFLSPGVTDVLNRLGALDAIRSTPAAWPRGMRVTSGQASFLLSYSGEQDPCGRTALGIQRPIFDQILLDHARRRGARVSERFRALAAIVENGRVAGARVRGPAGEAALRARFVVAADGSHSAVARSLGLDRPARWPRRLGLVARYGDARTISEFGEMYVGHDLYCGLAPVGDGLVNVGLVSALRVKRRDESIERYFERRLSELPGAVAALDGAVRVTPVRGVGPLARRVHRVAGPGYLLVGDAAGFLDPFTGEGVYRALRGAELAAGAIARALRCDDALPASYEQARQAEFADKDRVCLLIQCFLNRQRSFDYVVRRLRSRPQLTDLLAGVLGDYQPARPALQPGFLWALLRP